jgi:hypothetical protein
LGAGQKLEQMQSNMTIKRASKPAAQAQLAVVHLSGWSTKTATRGSKKFDSKLLTKPLESFKKAPLGGKESEHDELVSEVSKHSHLGRVNPSTLAAKLQTPLPAQLKGQNKSGQALLNRGQ